MNVGQENYEKLEEPEEELKTLSLIAGVIQDRLELRLKRYNTLLFLVERRPVNFQATGAQKL